jgi:hypothetical protein
MGRIKSSLSVFFTQISVCSYPGVLAENKDGSQKRKND